MSEKSVMDEVNAALGDDAAPAPEPEVETEVETEGGDSHPESESEGGDSHPEDESEGEPEPEGEPEGEPKPEKGPNGERERNPDGTWKKEEPKKDFVNDPVPENLKKETSERMRGLIDIAKTVTAERDKYKTDFDYLVQGVEATGTSPQQYGEALSWLALFNSRDPAQQEKALELIENVAERLATLLGKDRTVGDPLAAHADLKEAVTKGQITQQYAKEIARTRNGQTFRTELQTAASTEAQASAAKAEELSTARQGLTELEQTLRDSDPQYEAKKAVLVPALQPVFAIIPPSQWVAKWKEAYRNIKVGAPAATKPVVPKNQPLRAGRQPAGGQTKEPSSMLEAISGALGSMGK